MATRDVQHALQYLQNTDRTYKEIYCNTGTRNVRVYAGPDQNKKAIQTNIQARNLAKACSSLDNTATYTHRKRDGVVLRNRIPIAQVEPIFPNGAEVAIGFFPLAMADTGLDEDKVKEVWGALRPQRDIGEAVRWCS